MLRKYSRFSSLLCASALLLSLSALLPGAAADDILPVWGKNSAPVAENFSLTTYKDVEVQGTFSAVDPEGDLLTFQLVSQPARGSVKQTEEGGAQFVYTPYEGKKGKDVFTYVAVDALGNTSSPATVTVRIEKQKTQVTYSDMSGQEGHREALRLAETGLMVGEQVNGQYFFNPAGTVTRAQFTALALSVAGVEAIPGVTVTGFADDDAMAVWAKPYVSAALRSGMIRGSYDSQGRVVFRPEAPITAAEAAVILNKALNVTDVVSTMAADSPAWCAQAVANLSSCGAMPASATLSEPLTRSQCAIMLDRALDVMAARNDKGWFNW